MSDLAEFLLARIAEDEGVARGATGGGWHEGVPLPGHVGLSTGSDVSASSRRDAAHIARYDPARVLAECKAKRRIIEGAGLTLYRDLCLRALATVYADHPDYREEWRP